MIVLAGLSTLNSQPVENDPHCLRAILQQHSERLRRLRAWARVTDQRAHIQIAGSEQMEEQPPATMNGPRGVGRSETRMDAVVAANTPQPERVRLSRGVH